MRLGMLGSAIIRIENDLKMEIEKVPHVKLLPRPRGHDMPLNIEWHSSQIVCSFDWLKEHGLNPRKLNLYQILAPNAYSPIEDYIPSINKTVQSTVHEVSSKNLG